MYDNSKILPAQVACVQHRDYEKQRVFQHKSLVVFQNLDHNLLFE